MIERTYRGHIGIGSRVTGVALVAKDDFSARYDLDRLRGGFSPEAHKLRGQGYVGGVLGLDNAKGGVATAWMLYEMKARAMAPAALLLNAANPIMAQGAALADLPFMDRFEADITDLLRTGDKVTVDPPAGLVIVHGA